MNAHQSLLRYQSVRDPTSKLVEVQTDYINRQHRSPMCVPCAMYITTIAIFVIIIGFVAVKVTAGKSYAHLSMYTVYCITIISLSFFFTRSATHLYAKQNSSPLSRCCNVICWRLCKNADGLHLFTVPMYMYIDVQQSNISFMFRNFKKSHTSYLLPEANQYYNVRIFDVRIDVYCCRCRVVVTRSMRQGLTRWTELRSYNAHVIIFIKK